jgi:hypothetical protein
VDLWTNRIYPAHVGDSSALTPNRWGQGLWCLSSGVVEGVGRRARAWVEPESLQSFQIYIYGFREQRSVYMARSELHYVGSMPGYPQKEGLIHSYQAVLHIFTRQILDCLC